MRCFELVSAKSGCVPNRDDTTSDKPLRMFSRSAEGSTAAFAGGFEKYWCLASLV